MALLLWHAFATPPAWRLNLGKPDDTRFTARFFLAEGHDGTTFRWSGPRSHLLLHGASPVAQVLELRLHGDERAVNGDWRMHLHHEREGQPFATLTMAPDWRLYQVLLPPRAVTSGLEAVPIYLTSSEYLSVSRDHRNLGAAVDQVQVRPVADGQGAVGSGWWPLLRALLLTWGVAVVAGIVWRLTRAGRARGHSGGNQEYLVLLVPAVCAIILVVWAYHNPYTLAWALPPLPWSLGIATLLLIGDAGQSAGERQAGIRYYVPLVLLVLAQMLFHTRWSVVAGIALACVAILLLAWGRGERLGEREEVLRVGVWGLGERPSIPLLLVLLLALGLRLYRIADLPYGLWRDEVRHGMFAIRMLVEPGYHPIYITEGGVNMPALGFYPFALAIAVWDTHIWSMRLVTALAGAFTVVPLYGVVVSLLRRRDVALLAAALLAISSWHITLSRFGFPSIIEPLLMLTGLWLILHATRSSEQAEQTSSLPGFCARRAAFCFFVGGLMLGMSAQMYHTGRAVPLIAGALALLMLSSQWQRSVSPGHSPLSRHVVLSVLRSPLMRHWLLALLGFILAVAPLAIYAVQQTNAYNNRVSAVFLLSEASLRGHPPLAALDEALGKHALMFNVEGDANGRHHAPHYPLLDVVTGLGFLVGCALLLRHWRDWRVLFLGVGLAITLLPSVLAVQGPHAMRSIGAIAFACTIAALGWVEIGRIVVQHATVWRPRLLLWSAVVVLALVLNVRVYFVAMPTMPGVWQSFYPIHTRVGVYVRQVADQHGSAFARQVYVPQGLIENDVFTYLVYGLPVQTFKGDTLSQPAEPGALFVLSGYSHEKNVENLRPYIGDDPPLVGHGSDLPGTGTPSFFVYRHK